MKVKYYEDADLLSLRISNKPYYDATKSGDVIVHYTKEGQPVLIEILNAAKFLKDTDKSLPKRFQKELWSQDSPVATLHQIRK